MSDETILTLTADIVAAHVSHNSTPSADLPAVIRSVYKALAGLGHAPEVPLPALVPAVSIRSSIKQDHIACLECGKKMSMLKRHLSTDHKITGEEYKARWSLPNDYPLVAPAYAERRRDLAKKIGLGRKPAVKAEPAAQLGPKKVARKEPANKSAAKTTDQAIATVPDAKAGKATAKIAASAGE